MRILSSRESYMQDRGPGLYPFYFAFIGRYIPASLPDKVYGYPDDFPCSGAVRRAGSFQ